MDEQQIDRFLRRLGCTKIKAANAWVNASCPLARWRHGSGRDDHPSFGIVIAPGSESFARCQSGHCGYHGTLNNLLNRLKFLGAKLPYDELYNMVQFGNAPSVESFDRRLARARNADGEYEYKRTAEVAGITVSKKTLGRFADPENFKPLPESDLDIFMAPPPEVMAYLLGPERNLTERSVVEWQIGYHLDAKRVAIPVRDVNGSLVGVSGRLFDPEHCPKCGSLFVIDDEQKEDPNLLIEGAPPRKVRWICPKCHRVPPPKFLHSLGFHRDFFLFGENRIRQGVTGYVVEGHFDAIYLQQQGYNAVAIMGGSLSHFQLEKAVRFFTDLVVVPDGDEPGYKIAARVKEAASARMPVKVVDVPADTDPDELTSDQLLDMLGPPYKP